LPPPPTKVVILPQQGLHPSHQDFFQCILHQFHSTPEAGLSSVKLNLNCVAASFYWWSWKKDIKNFIKQLFPQQILTNKIESVTAPL